MVERMTAEEAITKRKEQKKTKRYLVAIQCALARPMIEEAQKQGRSFTNFANWVLLNHLIDRGYKITHADASEWEIRHKPHTQYANKAEAFKGIPVGEPKSEHGRSESSTNAVSGVQDGDQNHNPGVDGQGAGNGEGVGVV